MPENEPIPFDPDRNDAMGSTSEATLAGQSSRFVASGSTDSYDAAVTFLLQRINFERNSLASYTPDNFRLDRIRSILEELGNPQQAYEIVHVAGTKGKGTVSHLVAQALTANGHRCGLYTSPHLTTLTERFQVDGVEVSQQNLVGLVEEVSRAAESVERNGGGPATFFEMTTAMAFLYFRQQNVRIVVLEVGLGGRLDTTNVCEPTLAVITSISLDHQKQLGDTLAEIAFEKAGIIKPDVPTIVSAKAPEAVEVIERCCRDRNAPLRLINRDFVATWVGQAIQRIETPAATIQYSSQHPESMWHHTDWSTCLLGQHQSENVAAAIASLETLQKLGWQVDLPTTHAALAGCAPSGRLELVLESPWAMIDTAHNPASVRAGIEAINTHFPGYSICGIFAVSGDKNYDAMLRLLLEHCESLVLTRFLKNPRCLELNTLSSLATQINEQESYHCDLHIVDAPGDAWDQALAIAREQGRQVVYAAGSFFLAAELLEQFNH